MKPDTNLNKEITLLLIAFTCLFAKGETSNCDQLKRQSYPGFVFTKSLDVSLTKSTKAIPDLKIEAGKVCAKGCVVPSDKESSNEYRFALDGARETLFIEKDFITYYKPAQDDVPTRYAKTSLFYQAVKK